MSKLSKTKRMCDAIVKIEAGTAEIRELKEELETWRDNMADNNMDHLPKFEELEERIDELETMLDELDTIASEGPDFEFPKAFS